MTIDRLEGGTVPSLLPSAGSSDGGVGRENKCSSGRAAAVAGDAAPGAAMQLDTDRPAPAPAAGVCCESSSGYNGCITPEPRGDGQEMMRQLLIILFKSGQRGRRNPTTQPHEGFHSRTRRKMSSTILRRMHMQPLFSAIDDDAAAAAAAAAATTAADGNLFLLLIGAQQGGSIGVTACHVGAAAAVGVWVEAICGVDVAIEVTG